MSNLPYYLFDSFTWLHFSNRLHLPSICSLKACLLTTHQSMKKGTTLPVSCYLNTANTNTQFDIHTILPNIWDTVNLNSAIELLVLVAGNWNYLKTVTCTAVNEFKNYCVAVQLETENTNLLYCYQENIQKVIDTSLHQCCTHWWLKPIYVPSRAWNLKTSYCTS